MAAPQAERKQGQGVDPQLVQGIAGELGEGTMTPFTESAGEPGCHGQA